MQPDSVAQQYLPHLLRTTNSTHTGNPSNNPTQNPSINPHFDCSEPFKICFNNCHDATTRDRWIIVVSQLALSFLFLLLAVVRSRLKTRRLRKLNATVPSPEADAEAEKDKDRDKELESSLHRHSFTKVASYSVLDKSMPDPGAGAGVGAGGGSSDNLLESNTTLRTNHLRELIDLQEQPEESEPSFKSRPGIEKEKSVVTFKSAPPPIRKSERPVRAMEKMKSAMAFGSSGAGVGVGVGAGVGLRPTLEKEKSTVTFDDSGVIGYSSAHRPRPGMMEREKSTVTFESGISESIPKRILEPLEVVYSDHQLHGSHSKSTSENDIDVDDPDDASREPAGSYDYQNPSPSSSSSDRSPQDGQDLEEFLPSRNRQLEDMYNKTSNYYEIPPHMRKSFAFGRMSSMRGILKLSRDISVFSSMTNRNSGSRQNLTVECDSDSPVLQTHRSETNFLRTNDDEDIEYPSDYGAEYKTLEQDSSIRKKVLRSVMTITQAQCIILASAGYAFFTSSLVSLLSIRFKFEDDFRQYCGERECDDDTYREYCGEPEYDIKEWVESNSTAIKITLDGYKFLPIFLLLAYMGFLVERWRNFLLTCHIIQGRIHDIGLLCGSGVKTPIDLTSQKKLYTIYRYLNVIHILCLKNFSPDLKHLKVDPNYVKDLCLLTQKEAILVSSMENKARDGVLTLLAFAVKDLLERPDHNSPNVATATIVLEKICELRGSCSKLHDLFVRDNPNEYIISMQALVNIYGGLVVIGFPFVMSSLTSSSPTILGCIQPAAFLGPFFILLSLNFPLVLFKKLQNPFAEDGGIEVDNLIASTELCLFQNMRCLWHIERGSDTHNRNHKAAKVRRRRFSVFTKGTYGEL